jgi:hypothetical protein
MNECGEYNRCVDSKNGDEAKNGGRERRTTRERKKTTVDLFRGFPHYRALFPDVARALIIRKRCPSAEWKSASLLFFLSSHKSQIGSANVFARRRRQ